MELLRSLRHLAALCRIGILLARANLLEPLEAFPGLSPLLWIVHKIIRPLPALEGKRPGQRLAWALQTLGPSFIKLGQVLSTRADLVGEQVAADLSELQDRIPPFPTDQARAQIEAELGQPIATLFSSFDDVAIAAASVAQVHFAITSDGREVAVKVLRPGIEAAFMRDLDLLSWIATRIETYFRASRRLKPVEVVARLAQSVAFEMDLRFEAASAAELAENFKGDPDFRVPVVDWERTAQRVLTTERIHGIPIDETERIRAAGFDPEDIVKKAAAAFFAMVFRDGFFHADMHPGNLFVDEQGRVAAVDFGIMGRLDDRHRYYIADMLLGFLTGNFRKVAEVHFDAGFVPRDQSIEDFTLACRSIGEPLLGRPLEQISVGRLLSQLFQVTSQFRMETQPQLLMLQKTMVLAEGIGRQLAPSANMWLLTRPLIEDWMAANRSPPARMFQAAGDLVGLVERLPAIIRDAEKLILDLRGQAAAATPTRRPGWHPELGPSIPLWIAALSLLFLALHFA